MPPAQAARQARRFTAGHVTNTGRRVVIYGAGGMGKSTLAALAAKCLGGRGVRFIDLESRLSKLLRELSAIHPDLGGVDCVDAPPAGWTLDDVRDALHQADLWTNAGMVVIDSATRLEQLAFEHARATIPVKGADPLSGRAKLAESVEDWPYGKGPGYVYDRFLPVLADLDEHTREGRHVVLIAHDCTVEAKNVDGENHVRIEPRLASPNSGKASIRLAVKEWADDLLLIRQDVVVEGGKAVAIDRRTIYAQERPNFMAKSLTLNQPIPYSQGKDQDYVWRALLS